MEGKIACGWNATGEKCGFLIKLKGFGRTSKQVKNWKTSRPYINRGEKVEQGLFVNL